MIARRDWKSLRDEHVPEAGIDYWPLDAIAMADPPLSDLHLIMDREGPIALDQQTYVVPVRTALVTCSHGRPWLSWRCAIDAPQERFFYWAIQEHGTCCHA